METWFIREAQRKVESVALEQCGKYKYASEKTNLES